MRITILLLLAACQPTNIEGAHSVQAAADGPSVALPQVLADEQELEMEENPDVLTNLPTLSIRDSGEFLVADLRQHQIRRYTPGGDLLAYFGRQGAGPGEFERLVAGLPLPGGDVLAIQAFGNWTRFDSLGRVLDTGRLPINPLFNAAIGDDGTVLVTGRREGDPNGPLVHVWDLDLQSIRNSFFHTPPHPPRLSAAYSFASSVGVAVRGDSVAVITALSDTVYIYTSAGSLVRKLPIRSTHFRRINRPPPADMMEPEARVDWSQSFSRMSQVFWAPDGTLFVQFFDLPIREPDWRLVALNSDGTKRWEMRDSPRMLSISARDSRVFFLNPAHLESNKWLAGTIVH